MSRNVDGNRDLTEIFLDGNVDCHKQFAESNSQTVVSANLGSLAAPQLAGPCLISCWGGSIAWASAAHLHQSSVQFWPRERADVTVSSPGWQCCASYYYNLIRETLVIVRLHVNWHLIMCPVTWSPPSIGCWWPRGVSPAPGEGRGVTSACSPWSLWTRGSAGPPPPGPVTIISW